MILSIVARQVRITSLYKYVILQEELSNIGIDLKIYLMKNAYINAVHAIVNDYKEDPRYSNYCSKILKLNVVYCEGKSKTPELLNSFVKNGILDSDYIIWSAENDKMIFPPNKEIIRKIIFTKLRFCNDVFFHDNFIEKPKMFWFPSRYYNNHYNISFFMNKFGSKEVINSIGYVSPIELCDVKNPYITLNKNDLIKKYKIDENKKTFIYYLSRPYLYKSMDYEKDIVDKFLSDKFKSKYNILFAAKPYNYLKTDSNYRDVQIIDFFDYDTVMREIVSGVLGGISTATRESLVFEKPVLSVKTQIIHKKNFPKKRQEITSDGALKQRFPKSGLSNKHQFEGLESLINDDWDKNIEKMFSVKYDFSMKRKIWCGDISLFDKIKKEFI